MGVEIETLQAGDGANFPRPGNKVECHYVLTLTNGTKVDSSRDRGQPFSFNLGKGEVSISNFKFKHKLVTELYNHFFNKYVSCLSTEFYMLHCQ